MESNLNQVESKVIIVHLEEWEACENLVTFIDCWFLCGQRVVAVNVLEGVIFRE